MLCGFNLHFPYDIIHLYVCVLSHKKCLFFCLFKILGCLSYFEVVSSLYTLNTSPTCCKFFLPYAQLIFDLDSIIWPVHPPCSLDPSQHLSFSISVTPPVSTVVILYIPEALPLPLEVCCFFFLWVFYWVESAAGSQCPWVWDAECSAVGGMISYNELTGLKCQLCACCLVQATTISYWCYCNVSNGFFFHSFLFTIYSSYHSWREHLQI